MKQYYFAKKANTLRKRHERPIDALVFATGHMLFEVDHVTHMTRAIDCKELFKKFALRQALIVVRHIKECTDDYWLINSYLSCGRHEISAKRAALESIWFADTDLARQVLLSTIYPGWRTAKQLADELSDVQKRIANTAFMRLI